MTPYQAKKASFSQTGVTFYTGQGQIGSSSGSSKWNTYDGKIFEKSKSQPRLTPLKKKQPEREGFRVNKTLVRNKAEVFMRTRRAKQFMAFYSVSFPLGYSDQDAIKSLNIWLTRIRKLSPKINYLWVAERQKNGTIHFHLLVDRFLNIRIVNYYMGKTIDGINKDQDNKYGSFNRSKYNGVDVKRVFNLKGLRNYITKYISKQFAVFSCRANGMSRYVSAIFTKVITSAHTGMGYWDHFQRLTDSDPFAKAIKVADLVWWIPYCFGIPPNFRNHIDDLNQKLFQMHYS